MPPPTANPTPTPNPTNHTIFDPWNTSATGHQRAENPYSGTTSWRETRQAKLAIQFAGDSTTTSSTTGEHDPEGGEGQGEWKWLSGEEAARHRLGCRDIRMMMGGMVRKRGRDVDVDTDGTVSFECKYKKGKNDEILCQTKTTKETNTNTPGTRIETAETNSETKTENKIESAGPVVDAKAGKKILTGTTIYINGSTMPHISDHRLKSLLVAHGAEVAISLARRSVTHVIIGKPNTGPAGPGAGADAGGGLAAGKLQKEIARGGCRGVKVVGVEWALESIKAGKRLSEARFAMDLAPGGQRSVLGMFRR